MFPNLGLISKTTLSHVLLVFSLRSSRVPRRHFISSVLLMLFVLYASFGSLMHYNSKTITQSLTLISMSIVYFVIGFTKADDESFEILFNWSTLTAAISLVFYFFVPEFTIRNVTAWFNNSDLYSLGGIAASWQEALLPRLNLFTPEPSFFGFIWSSILVFGIARESKTWKFVIIFCAIFLTFSRTALVMIFLWFILRYRKASLLILGLSLPYTVPLIGDSITSDLSIVQRFGSLGSAYDAWNGNYILGIGWGSFFDYASERFLDYKDIFNLHLRVLVETGVLGFFLYMVFWFSHFDLSDFFGDKNLGTIVLFVGMSSFSAYNLWILWYLLVLNRSTK